MLRHVQEAPEEFGELLAGRRGSAPGPDGLPYSVHRCTRRIGTNCAVEAYYRNVFRGGRPPGGFAAGRTVFANLVDRNGQLERAPDALRPLTQLNRDCKVLTSAMCAGLRRQSEECIYPSQMLCDPADHDR